ncbi:MAG: PRC-barrel domain-containing protein [Terrimicrobiaceae bacterium]
MNHSLVSGLSLDVRSTLFLLAFCLAVQSSPAQVRTGQWDEVVGKEIKNNQGVRLGTLKDSVVDLEHGRYVGVIVSTGGFLGIGEKTIIVPPGALRDDGTPRTLFLDMDEKTFRNAPTIELNKESARPPSQKVAEIYRYFGQAPTFATYQGPGTLVGQALEPLGYLRRGSKILFMPVENLQGVPLGYVSGLRDLNRVTGRLKGVVIQPNGEYVRERMKVVEPQDLRYNLKNNRLRLNDHAQEFKDSPSFNMSRGGRFEEEDPSRPGTPVAPLVHGESARSKEITLRITKQIAADPDLSSYGKNIDIGTINGKTTLRGRVVNAAARDRIVSYAVKVAGSGNVIDQIVIDDISAAEKAIDR